MHSIMRALLAALRRVERHRKIGESSVVLASWEWQEIEAALAQGDTWEQVQSQRAPVE